MVERLVHFLRERVLQSGFGATGFVREEGEQLVIALRFRFLQFAQRDVRIDRLLRADETERGFGHAFHGAFEQAFINVADLFHIKRLIREQQRAGALFEHLQGGEEHKHGAIINRQRHGGCAAPTCAGGATFKERKAVGVEQ